VASSVAAQKLVTNLPNDNASSPKGDAAVIAAANTSIPVIAEHEMSRSDSRASSYSDGFYD
jgi:hypothetical protein